MVAATTVDPRQNKRKGRRAKLLSVATLLLQKLFLTFSASPSPLSPPPPLPRSFTFFLYFTFFITDFDFLYFWQKKKKKSYEDRKIKNKEQTLILKRPLKNFRSELLPQNSKYLWNYSSVKIQTINLQTPPKSFPLRKMFYIQF